MEDRELLDDFINRRSQSAFRELVERHLPVVYSAARRMVRDPQLAEDVVQSVFTMLAQKAPTIRPPQVLGGWLYNTTRFLSMHTIRTEQRRREREQTAIAMQALDAPSELPDVAEHLEPAMAELSDEDRDALVLRFFGNRALKDVGAELGISEEAARKRVVRALERLRTVMEHRCISISTVLLATKLSASILAVPAGLSAKISASAFSAITTATLTKVTIMTLKTKLMIAGTAAGIAIIGTGTFLVVHSRSKVITPPPVPHAAKPFDSANAEPIRYANSNFSGTTGLYIQQIAVASQNPLNALQIALLGNNDARFTNYLDPEAKRTSDSSPAGHIKSLTDPGPSGSADYLKTVGANGTGRPLQACRFMRQDFTNESPFLGHRIRVSGWVKTKDVAHWVGFSALVLNSNGHIFSDGDMNGAPIQGTTDWQEIDWVTDIPTEPCQMYFGPFLYGTGELWADDFKMETVPSDTPVNDDRPWHVWSPNPNDYSVTTDASTTHDGHATLCLAYTPTDHAPKGSWMWWGQDIRTPDKFRGHTVQMTIWTKTENVSGSIHPNLRPKGANFELLAKDSLVGQPLPKGTTPWTKRVITCVIPQETQCLDTGCAFFGSGKVWLDMKSLKYEIAE
jgi:RNA polymerase sigma factor (sigma-70 family)